MGTFDEPADKARPPPASGPADGNPTEESGIQQRPRSGPRHMMPPPRPRGALPGARPSQPMPPPRPSQPMPPTGPSKPDQTTAPLGGEGSAPEAYLAAELADLDAELDNLEAKQATGDPVGATPPATAPTAPPDASAPTDATASLEDQPEQPDKYLGTTISSRYVVDDVIGEGGMGRVYLAHHKVIGKRVAIKILHADLAKDKEAVGRFVREARAASSIGNPHIVDISDFGETEDGSTYFVMEYLEGGSLGELLENRGALPVDLVCDIGLQLCDGLAAAHKHTVVHRDLKPDNITLVKQGNRDNFCKILDFGIAKVSTSTSSTKLTMAGAVFGTPHYMSPEQAAGAAIDHRTDIYSLGVMLYEMVSGRMPFNAENFMGILTQHMYKAPIPIRALVDAPDCAPGMEALILKCLSKKPDARYASMEELALDIRKFQADGVPNAVHEMMARSGSFNVPADYFKAAGPAVVPAPPLGPRPRNLGPRLVAVVGVAVAVLIVVLVMMRDSTTTAEPGPPPSATPLPSATARASAPASSATAAPVGRIAVLLFSPTVGAVAVHEGKEVPLPETFQVEPGKPIALDVKADGFMPRTIELDGSRTKVSVALDPDKRRPGVPARPGHPRPKAKGKQGSGDVVEPWED